ncbi:LOW QUALITY PROTEIN: outer dense fiber protein 2-like [Alosa alosa]|uniref:LOW QUALITY PROTEIN: outer dense fiber protein 2-like n=1 Tax=Alosa alosa TaxID=278164 RepID=UPI00201523CB|nr:LOW QUALITY PROTEIN: outer dense fiber protein 2-like [Alosa alosa]
MKTRSHSPPIHVHVPESTALHVHLKRGQSCTASQLVQNERPGILRATAKVRAKVPWIPPGKSTAPRDQYKWEGSSHCLEITPVPQSDAGSSPLKLADLSRDDQGEEGRCDSRSKYDRRADSLMSEGDPLMRKVKLQEKRHLLERQSEHLDTCQRLIGVQEEQLAEASKELQESRRANTDLRRSLEQMQEDAAHSRAEGGAQGRAGQGDIDVLLRTLVEAEIDGEAAAKQVAALRDLVSQLKQEKKLSRPDAALLGKQHEVLVKKLEAFENTNRALRQLLRDQHGRETDAMREMDEREVLLKRLAESEAEKMRLEAKLSTKMREAIQKAENLEGEKDLAKSSRYLSKALETTHGHLQKQLRKKEAENNQLGAQIEAMEATLQQQRAEMQALQEQIRELQRHQEVDQEALRQAGQSQRQRAEQSEGHASRLATQLQETEAQLADALSSAEELRSRHTKELRERKQQDLELIALKTRVTELTDELQTAGDKFRLEKEGLLDRLHRLTSESSSTRLENQRLRTTLSGTEDRLSASQSELQQLKSTIRDFENLVDGYKTQVQKTREESEEYQARLEAREREVRGLRAEGEREVEGVRRRVRELEPLGEALRRSEEQLKEAQEQEESHRRRSAEQSEALREIRLKVEQQSGRIETLQEKNLLLLEENKHLRRSVDTMDRRLQEANRQSGELLETLSKRDERVRSSQQNLEEKRMGRRAPLQAGGEAGESTDRVEQSLDRALTKERTVQAKALDLETQLNVAKSEMNQLRRCKDEMERRMQGRLEELKKKLEESDSTNRSLQSYVHYLKASYTNVFGDSPWTNHRTLCDRSR